MIREEDIPLFCSWYNHYIEHSSATFETEPLTIVQFSDRVHEVRKKYPWIVLEEDNVPVGYAYLSAFNERSAYDWTADVSVYVNPEHLCSGYGTQLMKALIELAETDGYKQLVSIIAEGNTVSERLHESFGFERIAEFRNIGYKLGQWKGVSHWVRQISSDFEENPVRPVNSDPYKEV